MSHMRVGSGPTERRDFCRLNHNRLGGQELAVPSRNHGGCCMAGRNSEAIAL